MSNATEFFGNLSRAILTSVNTAMPCKVISYDNTNRTANIQPLLMIKEKEQEPTSLPPVENVPILYQRFKLKNNGPISVATDASGTDGHVHNSITFTESIEMIPDLRAGDIVLAIFCQRSIDDALNGNMTFPGTARMFSIRDAVIVGVF